MDSRHLPRRRALLDQWPSYLAVLLSAVRRYAGRERLLRPDTADEDVLALSRKLTPGLAGGGATGPGATTAPRPPDASLPSMTDAPTDPEDAKIITLARSTRARSRAAEGAAVRDTDGRTYAASTVRLPSLRLSALRLAVAMAASSGVGGLEAAAVVTEAEGVDPADLEAVRDLAGPGRSVFRADLRGDVAAVEST